MFQFDLSLAELSLVGDAMALDVQQYPFAFPSIGVTAEERLQAGAAASDMLYGKGYARDGEFVREFADALGLFCRARPSIAVVGDGPNGPAVARAARKGAHGVLAQQVDDRMYFVLGDARGLVASVLNLLGEHGRGKGASATIPLADPASGPEDTDDFSTVSYLEGSGDSRGGYQRRQEVAVRQLLDGDMLGSGCIRVERRDRYGGPGERLLLRWIDTTTGRYAGYTTFGPDGAELMTFTPADRRFFGRTLDGFLQRFEGNDREPVPHKPRHTR